MAYLDAVNDGITYLSSVLLSTNTLSLNVVDGNKLPLGGEGTNGFILGLKSNNGNIEYIKCSSRSGNTCVIEARGVEGTSPFTWDVGSIIKNDFTIGTFKEMKDKQSETITQISSFPIIIPEADDTARLIRAINKAVLTNTFLDLKNTTLVLGSKVVIPRYLKLNLSNSIIKSTLVGGTIFEIGIGDNVILNGCLDGNLIAKHGIVILENSKNVFIDGVEIKNTYGDNISGSYGIQIKNGCENIHITKSKFKDITQLEDGIEGNAIGASRAILVGEVKGSSITQCKFERIGGFEDGDAIHVQTTLDAVYGWTPSRIFIEKNEFLDVKKRAVKIQASGVFVVDNYIESNYIGSEECPLSGISVFGNYNRIYKNKIKLKRANFGIEVSTGVTNFIDDNIVEVDKTKTYATARGGSLQSGVFLTGGAKGTRVDRNDITVNGVGVYSTLATFNTKINNNIFREETTTPIDVNLATLISIAHNTFLGNPYEAIKIRNPVDAMILNNQLENGSIGIRLFGTINKVRISGNSLEKMSLNKIRTTDVTSGIETLNVDNNQYARNQIGTSAPTTGAWLAGDTIINNTPSRPRNIDHWKCYSPGTPGAWFAYGNGWGTTAERPVLTTQDGGYTYFDTTLVRSIMWNGFSWLG